MKSTEIEPTRTFLIFPASEGSQKIESCTKIPSGKIFWQSGTREANQFVATQPAFNSTTNKFRIINFKLTKKLDCNVQTSEFFGFIGRYPRPILFWKISVSANFGPKFERLNFAILKLMAVELNASWVCPVAQRLSHDPHLLLHEGLYGGLHAAPRLQQRLQTLPQLRFLNNANDIFFMIKIQHLHHGAITSSKLIPQLRSIGGSEIWLYM